MRLTFGNHSIFNFPFCFDNARKILSWSLTEFKYLSQVNIHSNLNWTVWLKVWNSLADRMAKIIQQMKLIFTFLKQYVSILNQTWVQSLSGYLFLVCFVLKTSPNLTRQKKEPSWSLSSWPLSKDKLWDETSCLWANALMYVLWMKDCYWSKNVFQN